MQGIRSGSAPLLGPRESKGEVANSEFVPLLGTPDNVGITKQFRPLLGLREGKDKIATSDFVPLVEDPRECKGCVAIVLFLAPEKAGVRQPLLILSP